MFLAVSSDSHIMGVLHKHHVYTLQVFENFLQLGEGASAKEFIQGFDISWASKSVELDLSTLTAH